MRLLFLGLTIVVAACTQGDAKQQKDGKAAAGATAALPVSVIQVAPREVPGDFYVTDGGNFILDCAFGPLDDAPALAARLKSLPGVVEHGLFIDLAHTIVIAGAQGIAIHERQAAAARARPI